MANEIAAACIQGAFTALTGIIAVRGGLRGLKNWQLEIPGKRRLEIAESCLAGVYALRTDILHLGKQINYTFSLENEPGALSPDARTYLLQILTKLNDKVSDDLYRLNTMTAVAQVYFGPALEQAQSEVVKFRLEIGDDYELLTRLMSRARGFDQAYKLLCERSSPDSQTLKERTVRYRRCADQYEEVLKPFLSIHVTSKSAPFSRRLAARFASLMRRGR